MLDTGAIITQDERSIRQESIIPRGNTGFFNGNHPDIDRMASMFCIKSRLCGVTKSVHPVSLIVRHMSKAVFALSKSCLK